MKITLEHVDRAGKVWRFRLDCNEPQQRIFAATLRSVKNAELAQQTTFRYYQSQKENTAFAAEIERAILEALTNWAEAKETRRREVMPPAAASPEGHAPAAKSAAPYPSVASAEIEEPEPPPPYYWENF